jgi:hypothetical protein
MKVKEERNLRHNYAAHMSFHPWLLTRTLSHSLTSVAATQTSVVGMKLADLNETD